MPRFIFWASGLVLGPCSPRGALSVPSPTSPPHRVPGNLGGEAGEDGAWRAACKPSRESRMSTQIFSPCLRITPKQYVLIMYHVPANHEDVRRTGRRRHFINVLLSVPRLALRMTQTLAVPPLRLSRALMPLTPAGCC